MTENLKTEEDIELEIEERVQNANVLMRNFRVAECEKKRFLCFGIMFAIIGFIYSFMRILKDTFVIVRQEPACILYIKIFYILPLSFAFIFLIQYMMNSRSVARIFSIFCFGFMVLFFLFGTIILFEESIMFDSEILKDKIKDGYLSEKGLGWAENFVLTLNEPIATLIFIAAEMWGSLILSYLFMSYLNESCTAGQHGRFLPPLFIITNFSLLLSAIVTTGFFQIRASISDESEKYLLALIFGVQGALTLGLLYTKHYLERYLLVKPLFVPRLITKKKKAKVGFSEGIKTMSNSKFLKKMCIIVFFYSMIYNMQESVYKNGIKQGAIAMDVEKGRYAGFYSNLDQYITSISVIILNLTSFSNLIATRGWFLVAMISPVIALIASVFIFGLATYNTAAVGDSLSFFNNVFSSASPMFRLENFLGMLSLSAAKIFKYSSFDVSKEKISMRIEDRYRPKFKSIYDGIFNKFGKSAGSIYGILIETFDFGLDIREMAPVSALFSIGFTYIWFGSVSYLSNSFDTSLKEKRPVDIDLNEKEESEEEIHKIANK